MDLKWKILTGLSSLSSQCIHTFLEDRNFSKKTTHREMSLAYSLPETFKRYVGKHKITDHALIDEFHPQFCRVSDIGTRAS